jgi:hypothetical protein
MSIGPAAIKYPEQKMLQGVWRGYAGDAAQEGEKFGANQRQLAEAFAKRRAAQTGAVPRVEMMLIDPELPGKYRIHPPDAKSMSVVRKLKPEDVQATSDFGPLQSKDPFWYNPTGDKLVRFPESGSHTKSITDPAYTERVGLPTLTDKPQASDIVALDAALMGRTDRKDPSKLFLMQTGNPDDSALSALRRLLMRGDLPHNKLDYSAGERLYENLPLDDVINAQTLEDLAKWRQFAEGGIVNAQGSGYNAAQVDALTDQLYSELFAQ